MDDLVVYLSAVVAASIREGYHVMAGVVYYLCLCEMTLFPVASKVQRTKPLCSGDGISQPVMSRVSVGGQ
jgi:hypothetical protein